LEFRRVLFRSPVSILVVVAGLQPRAYLAFDGSVVSSDPWPVRDVSRSPSHRTLPLNRRILPCARVCTSNRSPASTAARFVLFPELRIASPINRSSISMFVRILPAPFHAYV